MELFNEINEIILFQTWLGALCTHLLSLYSDDFNGTIPFIKKLIPNKSEAFYFRIDFVILPVIGALLAYVLLEPSSLKSSIFAGISWSGTLIAILRKNNNQFEASENE
ncbi:hypothetical protein B0I03_101559 [Flavobacterium aquaticum]|uniref:Uncharacterized protein n=1 Tax=Flavobacterium aquaticum TaxID=1236486 RepID=A0A327YWL2_9FLAO|nr:MULTISPECIES: hypothetical protein [Flavobacterium]RAK25383.1 hypothetical protein B0I03_101559 [Flavobacterium aquaticum]HLO74627.1 hypothetical protein [Flavobacterium sp.]